LASTQYRLPVCFEIRREFAMLRRPVGLVFQCQGEARPHQDVRDHQFIVSALELAGLLQPPHKPILQLYIVIEQVQAVGEPEIASDNASHRRVVHLAGFYDRCPLVAAVSVVPLQQRMTSLERFRNFGITPIGAENPLDVIRKEIGEGLPGWRPMDGITYRDDLMPVNFPGNDRSTKPLLVLPDALRCAVTFKNALDLRWGRGGHVNPAAAFLEFSAAAAEAWLVSLNF
jgi:hypothetical protein